MWTFLPPEVIAQIVGHGPAGGIILILLGVIRYIFKRWDADRERLIEHGQKYAELAWSSSKALETANKALDAANKQTADLFAGISTLKFLKQIDHT